MPCHKPYHGLFQTLIRNGQGEANVTLSMLPIADSRGYHDPSLVK
jgi:hypothetical protein